MPAPAAPPLATGLACAKRHVFVSREVIQHPVAYSPLMLVLTKTNALISFQIATDVHLLVFGPVDLVVALINPLD